LFAFLLLCLKLLRIDIQPIQLPLPRSAVVLDAFRGLIDWLRANGEKMFPTQAASLHETCRFKDPDMLRNGVE